MSIIAIDRWRRRLWIAYTRGVDGIIFPIGSLDNDANCIYWLAHIVAQHQWELIIVWYPSQEEKIQKAIDKFITQLQYVISPDCKIEKVNEDYSSVQAGAVLGNFRKNPAEDTLAAAKILEEYQEKCKITKTP